MKRRTLRAVAALCTAVSGIALSGCSAATLDPTRIPVPGAYVPREKYTVKVEFSSVLNLPGRAKVDFGGVQIGVLDRVQLVDTAALVYLDIDGDVSLPANTRAELRQATVLGDIYIAMIPPADPSGDVLHNGATIPMANTAPASNVEDLLRSMASLVGGGTLNTLQKTIIDINRAFPAPDELARIHQTVAGSVRDLSANQETINQILSSVDSISRSAAGNAPAYGRLINEGPEKFAALAEMALSIADFVISVGNVGKASSPMLDIVTPDVIQALSYFTPFIHTLATADTTIPVIADKLVRLLRDRLIPLFGNGGPKYTVTEIGPPDGSLGADPAERADEAIRRMQTMGLVP